MSVARTRLAVLAGLLALPTAAAAQEYDIKVVARNLARPTGIAAAGENKVYFTQLPTPGVSAAHGGTNTVSVLNPRSGRVRHLIVGEPEPTNLAVTRHGGVYWTCRTAGVVVELEEDNQVNVLFRGLERPTGLAAFPNGRGLFWTELPTPGVAGPAGGRNKVVFGLDDGSFDFPIDVGDPEPTDVTVDRDGVVYWTCASAGVIVKFVGGVESVVLRGLSRPTGLATDLRGNLYFTELPTPGVKGADGGRNKVSRLDLRTGVATVIHAGDPDPVDVTALTDGSVYWTCRTAGVILEATPRRHGDR